MFKYLVVGCGGSGGATLAYLMDQISSELAAYGIEDLPVGMQFVHVDVPVAPDTREPGIGDVRAQGGTYIGTAPQSGSYSTLDSAMTSVLAPSSNLQYTATWAPRTPTDISVPISAGAGQMRAVGRMLTLSHATSVHQRLTVAADALNTVEANSDMSRLARTLPGAGEFDAAAPIITIVVSSMAGGAGASMALDVCRLLAHLPQIDPNLTGVFMIAPEVFDALPSHSRSGVRANSLAMLGEIVAAQTGAASAHDRDLLGALGLNLSPIDTPPFKRVFPVGRFTGTERTQFGDGSVRAVYRGLGRGLAALMLSGKASQEFVSYDFGNPGPPARHDVLGWGAASDDLPWGAFGFGSLSLGRDRYRHYAAQRLARTAVDRLVGGHLQPGSSTSSSEQLRSLLDSQWDAIATAAGLPQQTTPGSLSQTELAQWMRTIALPLDEVNSDVRQITDGVVRPNLPQLSGGVQPWLGTLGNALASQRPAMLDRTEKAAYRWAYAWAQHLHDQVIAEVESSVVRFGLPFARATVERMESTLSDLVIPRLHDLARADSPDPGTVPTEFSSEAGRIKGSVSNGQQLLERLVSQVSTMLARLRYGRSAALAENVLRAFVPEVLGPLRQSLSDAIEVLQVATAPSAGRQAEGLANVETDRYGAWPSDSDQQVPSRFGVADNEVLLTPYEGFGATYVTHLPAAVGDTGAGGPNLEAARGSAARMVIGGQWPVAAGHAAPGGLVETVARWRAALFVREPESGEPLQPAHGRYQWHVGTPEVLDRAQLFVQRPGESFQRYCSQSLGSYVAATDATPAQAAQRRIDIVDRFAEAVVRARPLISVDPEAIRAVHNRSVEYFFKFSAIPFEEDSAMVDALTSRLDAMPNLAPEMTGMNSTFNRALVAAAQSQVTRIDLFGSYRNYSPVVFSALLNPVASEWTGLQDFGRAAFWQHRRARPLVASLPMSRAERRAMIGGWYVGQLTGRIWLPEAPFDQPVRIWDGTTKEWVDFPSPLLTPPSGFLGKSFDWLPAVLESVLLALAQGLQEPVMSSMRPYQLLRGLWDSTANEPASGMLTLSAKDLLAAWIASGTTASGMASRAIGATTEDRFESATAWVNAIRDFASTQFMAPRQDGAAGGGEFSQIDSRGKAAVTPMFRDLAPDIRAVTADLIEVLGEARNGTASGTPSIEPMAGFGAF